MSDIQRIVAFVQSEWRTGLRLTTVAQAMSALGLPDDDEVRWQVGRKLDRDWQQHRRVSGFFRGIPWLTGKNLGRLLRFLPGVLFGFPRLLREAREWNPAVYILTEDEKLIARHILLGDKASRPVPSAAAMATALSLPADTVARGLAMLARLGFVAPLNGGYALASDYRRFLRGLGFNFHTIALSSGEVFNVPCAIDFMLLVSSRYADRTVTIDDACAHCTDRIRIVFERGQLVGVAPPETMVFEGGT